MTPDLARREVPLLTYEPLGRTMTLSSTVEDFESTAVFDLALQPLEALQGIVTPLAVRLWLGGRLAGDPYLDRARPPARSMWQLGEENPPDDVLLRPPAGRPFEVATTPDLSRHTLREWFAGALAQSPPTADYVPTLDSLVCEDQRARLVAAPDADSCTLRLEDRTMTRPLHGDGDGAWVAFPLPGLEVLPPVRVRVTNEGDGLVTDIWVSWSPWSTPGTPEHDAVRAAVRQMEDRGWTLHPTRKH